MADLGIGLIVVGAVVALAGIGGFIDTRKVDRRFKTGYKNNEPDTRNFERAGKFLLYGVGVCVIGAAMNSFTGSKDDVSPDAAVNDQSASTAQSVRASASETTESTESAATPPYKTVAQVPVENSDGTLASGASQSSDAIAPGSGTQEQALQNGDSSDSVTSANQSQTFLTSFDCRRAKADDEVAICGDAGLAAMDRQLGQLYDAAMKTISDPQALKQSESDWVITRHMCNGDVECLRHVYGARIGQFLGSLGSKPLIAAESQAEKE